MVYLKPREAEYSALLLKSLLLMTDLSEPDNAFILVLTTPGDNQWSIRYDPLTAMYSSQRNQPGQVDLNGPTIICKQLWDIDVPQSFV